MSALKISVVIPNYNYADYLPDCIDSVIAQTYPVHEIIVVDDGSTDDSVEVVKGYGDAVKLIQQPNRHVGAARNTGIKASSGDWIALLDSDDVWHPQKLEFQVKSLMQNHGWRFIGAEMCRCDGLEARYDILSMACHEVDLKHFLSGLPFGPSSMLIYRSCFDKVGYFSEDPAFKGSEDKDMRLRLSSQYRSGIVNCGLWFYRVHPWQMSTSKVGMMVASNRMVLQSFFKSHPCTRILYRVGMAHFYREAGITIRDDAKEPLRAILYFFLSLCWKPASYSPEATTVSRLKEIIVSFLRILDFGRV